VDVGPAGLHGGLRHRSIFGARLHDDGPARRPKIARAGRAVLHHARQDYGDRAVREVARERLEQAIHGVVEGAPLRPRHGAGAVGQHLEERSGRGEQDRPRREHGARARPLDLEGEALIAAVWRRHAVGQVLHDDDRNDEILGQPAKDLLDRGITSGRRHQDDDVVRRRKGGSHGGRGVLGSLGGAGHGALHRARFARTGALRNRRGSWPDGSRAHVAFI
jgi:hypothetical protein